MDDNPLYPVASRVTITYDVSDEDFQRYREERERRRGSGVPAPFPVTTITYSPDGWTVQSAPEA